MPQPAAKRLTTNPEVEASKCLFCGFCEPVCPTLEHGIHRGYGPRGRVYIVLNMLAHSEATRETLAAIYSCLLCGSCVVKCPIGVDVPSIIRAARKLLGTGAISSDMRLLVGVRGYRGW